ncbi:MAG: nucleotide exchange factor GrpE [Thaumarchaeota archaeon]|nr:nucleotide exchange factor GrpE [Nitrososphaerota archaeon]
MQQSNLVEEGADTPRPTDREELERMQEEIGRLLDLLQEERKKSDDYLTNLKYTQADLENYRKRMDREVREIEEFSTAGLVKKLVPVLDDLEMGAVSAESTPQTKEFLEGIAMVRKRLSSSLENEGLEEIKAVGETFNPELHEAVDTAQGTGEKDIIVEEIRKGYIFKGKILRPSMVKVELAMKKNSKESKSGTEQ